jgi:hypothetical protein
VSQQGLKKRTIQIPITFPRGKNAIVDSDRTRLTYPRAFSTNIEDKSIKALRFPLFLFV